MDNDELIIQNMLLIEEIARLKHELDSTKEHLKKYTAPLNKKTYYEKNKEEIKQKVKEYKKNTNYVVPKDVIKDRNKRAYQKRKEKLEKDKLERQLKFMSNENLDFTFTNVNVLNCQYFFNYQYL